MPASAWNKALLDNAARPSGALVYSGPEGAVLSDTQFDRLKRELTDTYQGARNAGRPLLLEGGLDWKAMSLTPKDMDFLEAKHTAAREIALAFGVPPMLLGIPGDNTYANFQEANRVLLPPDRAAAGVAHRQLVRAWLAPQFGDGIRLTIDTDRIDALAADRAALWERISNAAVPHAERKARGGRLRAARGRGSAGVIFAVPLRDAAHGRSDRRVSADNHQVTVFRDRSVPPRFIDAPDQPSPHGVREGQIHVRPDPHLHRARRPRASRAVSVGERRQRAAAVRAARTVPPPSRRFDDFVRELRASIATAHRRARTFTRIETDGYSAQRAALDSHRNQVRSRIISLCSANSSAHLDQIQRKAPAAKSPRAKPPARRKPVKRSEGLISSESNAGCTSVVSRSLVPHLRSPSSGAEAPFSNICPRLAICEADHARPVAVRVASAFSGDGTVEGYASLFGEIDAGARHGDAGRVRAHAEKPRPSQDPDAVPARPGRAGRRLARAARGFPRAVGAGKAHSGCGARARIARAGEAGAVDGLSIGFRTVSGQIDPRTRVRKLYQLDLWEISIVTFPLLAGARVRAVKQAAPSRGRARGRRPSANGGAWRRPRMNRRRSSARARRLFRRHCVGARGGVMRCVRCRAATWSEGADADHGVALFVICRGLVGVCRSPLERQRGRKPRDGAEAYRSAAGRHAPVQQIEGYR